MFFAILVLLSAISISVVAAYYSIIGLTTLFSGAVLAVTIMGIVLEIGKVVTATWLHRNWSIAPVLLKTYLTMAVLVLMFITSMGIFGYLSKAHLTQTTPITTINTQISKIDFQIEQEQNLIINEEKSIKSSQKIIDQLDKSMDLYFEKGIVRRALREREKQKQERELAQAEIAASNIVIKQINERITVLTTKKFDLEQQIKNVEIEVGPVKYIADLIYGEQKSKQLLEKTVRFVILILIFVFDPLAILLIIAANISFNIKNNKQQTIKPKYNPYVIDDSQYVPYPTVKNVEPNLVETNNIIEENKLHVSEDETVLAVPAVEAAKNLNLPKEEKEIVYKPLEPSAEDIEQVTKNIIEKASASPQVPYNLSSGDVGNYMKRLISEAIKEQFNKK